MLNLSYPIIGQFRGVLLVTEWTVAFLSIQLSLIFFLRYWRQKATKSNLRDLGFSSLFMGYGFVWIFYIIADYYASSMIKQPFLIWSSGSQRMLFLNFGYLSFVLGGFFFILIMERYKIFLKRRYFFTYIFSAYLVVYLIILFINIEITNFLSTVFLALFFLFFLFYLYDFVQVLNRYEKKWVSTLKYVPSYMALFIGYLLGTDLLVSNYGYIIRLIARFIQIFGLISILYLFINLPSLSEFDMEGKIEELYIIDDSGVCLFNKSFGNEEESTQKHLISSALTIINMVLEDLIKKGNKEKLSVIRKKGKILSIYTGEYISTVLISNKEIPFIGRILRKFVDRIEQIYGNVLKDWNGDVVIFKPVETIVDEVFGIS